MAEHDSDTPSMADIASNEEGNDGSLPQESGDEEDDDYDPSSFGFNGEANQNGAADDGAQPSASMAHRTTQLQSNSPPRVRTVGGFIVEEDEDDDDEEADGEIPGDSAVTTPARAGVTDGQDISLGSVPTSDTAAPLTSSTISLNGSLTADTVPKSDVAIGSTVAPLAVAPQAKAVHEVNGTPTNSLASTALPSAAAARLPFDRVGRLEDRIKDDPRADSEAWRELLQYYKEKDQLENIRKTYERFLDIFPTSASIWIEYIRFVLESMDRNTIDGLLSRSLERVQSLDLWNTYLDYLRRILPLSNDPSGTNRSTITQAFEAVLENVGIDPEAGKLWSEYIDFVSAGPGTVGGTGWQDAQKMDLIRKAYQRAVKIPHSELTRLWKEYDKFEMTLNKTNGRKALQEQSPHYMTARSANMQLIQWTHGLDRQSLPVLPPIVGCEGDDAFGDQVEKWRGWIAWEKTDPLVFKDEDMAAYRKRVLYIYNQAVMQLRFYPQIWYDAAQWCFEQGTDEMKTQGDKFLDQGIIANPESVLLALKTADRIETTLDAGSTDAVAVANGERLDVPFETVLKALYSLREKMVQREKRAIANVQEHFASLPPEDDAPDAIVTFDEDDDNDVDQVSGNNASKQSQSRQDLMQIQLQAVSTASRGQLDVLKRTISYVWVSKMRAFRRIQGQGMPNKPKKGFRGVFAEARPRGQLSSDVYIASALMEWHCYKDPSALKIFERGLKLFPTDELFAQEYIKHLISINDLTNARVVFETTITKILAPPPANAPSTGGLALDAEAQKRLRVRPLFGYMHSFESNYGDLAQIQKLERRMADLYPMEPDLARFADRFTSMPPANFDAIDIQLIISPTQAKPKFPMPVEPPPAPAVGMAIDSIENPTTESNLRLGPQGPYIASPKRPLEDSDTDSPQRKFLRAESPLKGAAGRRMQMNAAAALAANTAPGFAVKSFMPGTNPAIGESISDEPTVPLLPKPVYEFLRKLPPAKDWNTIVFDPVRTVEFLRSYDLQAARLRAGR